MSNEVTRDTVTKRSKLFLTISLSNLIIVTGDQ
jgi:hypothetical protein